VQTTAVCLVRLVGQLVEAILLDWDHADSWRRLVGGAVQRAWEPQGMRKTGRQQAARPSVLVQPSWQSQWNSLCQHKWAHLNGFGPKPESLGIP
jgi:hypothetical protein